MLIKKSKATRRVLAVGLLWAIVVAWIGFRLSQRGPSIDDAYRIKAGMTNSEVEEMFGPPHDVNVVLGKLDSSSWYLRDGYITVVYNFDDTVALPVKIESENIFLRFRRRIIWKYLGF